MGKHEVGTPKYIANKIKAKGLQKLRWYCQMCQKQCRDENGFKCHMTSESHQRQLLLFAEDSRRYMDQFSKEFEKGYLELLKRQFGTKRVHANKVYQDYIADRNHLHMNATKWLTLTEFVKYLGREGKCVVDETEKGWFVTYIDRDPQTIAHQEAVAKKEKMDKDDKEKMAAFLEKQIIKGKQHSKLTESEYTELVRKEEEEKLTLELKINKKETTTNKTIPKLNPLVFKIPEIKKDKPEKRKLTVLDEIMHSEETNKEKKNRKDYWLAENIVVKVITKTLGDKYYKKKGFIKSLINNYCALVTMLDSGDVLKLDQANLETVIPSVGRKVKICNGAYRGLSATLKSLDEKNFCVDIEIDSGPLKGRMVKGVEYEDISKLHS